jgi:hypothetical protein
MSDELILLLIGIAVVVWLVRRGKQPAKRATKQAPERHGTALHMEVTGSRGSREQYKARIRHNFEYDLPSGWKTAESEIDVAGIQYRRAEAEAFVRGHDQAIRLEPEPKNPRDRNAIKVIGVYAKRAGGAKQETHIGYIPSEMAATLHDAGLTARVRGQLQNVYEGDNGYLGVRLDLLCLAEDLPRWEDA